MTTGYSHLSSIWSCGSTSQTYRREVVAAANRLVLEVGVGSGLNFSLYGKQVESYSGSTLLPVCWRLRA